MRWACCNPLRRPKGPEARAMKARQRADHGNSQGALPRFPPGTMTRIPILPPKASRAGPGYRVVSLGESVCLDLLGAQRAGQTSARNAGYRLREESRPNGGISVRNPRPILEKWTSYRALWVLERTAMFSSSFARSSWPSRTRVCFEIQQRRSP